MDDLNKTTEMTGRVLKGPRLGRKVSDLPIRDLFLKAIAKMGNKPFMVEGWPGGREWTYKELGEASEGVREWLLKMGLGQPGSVASICSPPSFHMFAFAVGAWCQGMTTHPIDPHLTGCELLNLVKASGASVVYWGWEGKEREEIKDALVGIEGGGLPVIGPGLPSLSGQFSSGFLLPPVPRDNVQAIVFSSGTTSHPKAVRVRDRALNIMSALFEMETEGLERILVTGMPFWTSFTVIVNFCLKNGKTMIIPRDTSDYKGIFQVIDRHKPEFWLAPPHVLLSMARISDSEIIEADTSSLVNVQTTGFALSSEQRKAIRDRVVRCGVKHWYATSEAGNITYWPHRQPEESTSVGRVCPTAQLKVIDGKTGDLLGPNAPGEIWVKTETMMAGYVGGAVAEMDAEGWLRTGDLGYYDENEYIYFLSRQRDVIRYLWLKIVPWELEAVLSSHPAVVESCVVKRPHPTDGEHPAAFVVSSQPITESQLLKYVQERVAETKRLRGGVFFVKSLPKGPTGKVLRKQLETILEEIDRREAGVHGIPLSMLPFQKQKQSKRAIV